ncbi:Tol-Pal system beta propeller repeat protein TolB [Mangrovitalea sediminis]|uniref:Tol-Pal system beta propeller repeat protein TolB n=1 Tax=Mangrovitalea sediminis TaxID=1982043 RepID=UPI001D0D0CFB|nr:Tol-Pal system beta propeller repeat protein TolB [Mangrovitalea sediminis]
MIAGLMMRIIRFLVVLCSFSLLAQSARAELLIHITKAASDAIPIAIVPFASPNGTGPNEDLTQIVRDDLDMSGNFKSLDPSRMLSLPSQGSQVYYRDWRLLGQRYLVIGQIQRGATDQNYHVQYELFDVTQQKQMLKSNLTTTANNLRSLAHVISDQVYKAITGVRGAFSTRLAFVTLDKEGGKSVYRLQVSDVDGQRAQVLLKSTQPILSPDWSPDAKKLAYVSFETGQPAIYIQDIATGKRQKLTDFQGLNSAPAWSPDGKDMLMTLSKDGNAEIYEMDLANRQLTRLTHHWAIDTEANWAPDGRQIVFTSDRSGGPQIYQMDLRTQDAKRLTFGGPYNASPRYSPDGKYIYYVHRDGGNFNIAKMNLSTGEQTILTHTDLDDSPSVAPNGRMLIYCTHQGTKSVLSVISVDGGSKYFLPAKFGDVREPAWSPFGS